MGKIKNVKKRFLHLWFGPTLVPSSLRPPPSPLPPPGYKACSGHISGGVPTVCTPFCYSSRADPTTLRAVSTTATAAVASPAETPRSRTLSLRRARDQTPGLSRNATISVSVSTWRSEFRSRLGHGLGFVSFNVTAEPSSAEHVDRPSVDWTLRRRSHDLQNKNKTKRSRPRPLTRPTFRPVDSTRPKFQPPN